MVKPSGLYFKPPEEKFEDCLFTWAASRRALKDVGFTVFEYDSSEEYAPRSPYSRDKFLIIEGKAFIPDANAVPKGRQSEMSGALHNDSDFFARTLERVCDEVIVTKGIWFETGNFIPDREEKTLFGGIHTHEDLATFKKMEELLARQLSSGWAFEPLTLAPDILRNPENPNSHWFYHLDLAQSERLNGDTVMYCSEAFTYASQRKLERHFNGALMPVSMEDAMAGAINAVAKKETVVPTAISDPLVSDLEDRGLKVVDPRDYEVEDFMLVNGGIHCMTNEV